MSRTSFLARVRTAVDTASGTAAARRKDAVAERLARPPAHPLPACAKVPAEDHEREFVRALEARGAEVVSIPDLAALPAAIESRLEQPTSSSPLVGEDRGGGDSRPSAVGIPPTPNPSPQGGGETRTRLLVGDDPRFATLSWTAAPARWNPDRKPEDGTAALTHAVAAVAETGTLVLASSAASPATLAFLPETHLVAVARETIVGTFEAAFARLRAAYPERLPRAVNLVSGPSRTGDIGGRIVMGAHGPRRLVVILYGATGADAHHDGETES